MARKYVIDTNSLFRLKFYPRKKFSLFEKFWEALENALSNGIVVFPREVFLETKSRPEIAKFLAQYPQAIIDNKCVYDKLAEVVARFPNMAYKMKGNKPQKQKYHADPHIISLVLCLREEKQEPSLLAYLEDEEEEFEVIIVTEEKNEENKIPWNAAKYGIRSITFLDLMLELGVN